MDVQYWYNMRTGQVESGEPSGRGDEAMGPYATRQEAEQALQTAQARTDAWDEEERREDEWRTGDPEGRNYDNNPFNDR